MSGWSRARLWSWSHGCEQDPRPREVFEWPFTIGRGGVQGGGILLWFRSALMQACIWATMSIQVWVPVWMGALMPSLKHCCGPFELRRGRSGYRLLSLEPGMAIVLSDVDSSICMNASYSERGTAAAA